MVLVWGTGVLREEAVSMSMSGRTMLPLCVCLLRRSFDAVDELALDYMWLVALLVALSTSCSGDFAVPRGTQIQCSSNAECPRGYVCRAALGACVATADLDDVPPAIVPGSIAISPAVGGREAVFAVHFDVTESLLRDPVATVAFGATEEELLLDDGSTDREALAYAYTYPFNAAAGDGTWPLSVRLVDTAGNPAQASLGSLVFDATPPALDGAAILSKAALTRGATVTLTFTLDEALRSAPLVSLVGGGAAADSAWQQESVSGLTYVFSYTPSVSAPIEDEGEYAVQITAVDLAGNESILDGGVLTLDFTAPALLGVTLTPEARAARPGQLVTVSLLLSEAVVSQPTVIGSDSSTSKQVSFLADAAQGAHLVFVYPVATGDDGVYSLFLDNLADAAGNQAASQDLGGLRLDGVGPNLVAYGQNKSDLLASDTLVVCFAADEALANDPEVSFGPLLMQRAALSSDCPSANATYQYELPVSGTGLVGSYQVLVALADPLGNSSVVVPGGASLDNRPPGLVNVFFSPAAARSGVTALLTVTVDEALAEQPVLTWDSALVPGGDPGFALHPLANNGFNYLWELPADEALEGEYGIGAIALVDQAGNPATYFAPTDFSFADTPPFQIDNQPPTINITDVSPASRKANASTQVVVTVACDSTLASLSATLGGALMNGPTGGAPSCVFTYDPTPPPAGTDTQGIKNVIVQGTDAAGNVGFGQEIVELDFTEPSILEHYASKAAYREGEDVLYTVTVSEALFGGEPSLTVSPVNLFLGQSPTGGPTTFVYKHTVAAAEDGRYTPTIDAQDIAGNNAAGVVDTDAIVIDTVAPQIVLANPAISGAVDVGSVHYANLTHRSGGSLVVSFEVIDENIAADPEVHIGLGAPASCTGTPTASGKAYDCTYTFDGSETDGVKTVSIAVVDLAGNTAEDTSLSVVYDFKAPAVTFAESSPSPAGLGDTVAVTVSFSEAIGSIVSGPTATPALPGTSSLTGGNSGDNVTFSWSWLAPTAPGADSTHALSLQVVDVAGNPATVSAGQIVLDRTLPTISSPFVSAPPPAPAGYANLANRSAGDDVTVTFSLNEGTPQVRIGPYVATCGTGPAFTCTYPLSPAATSGAKTVTIVATDAAGNTSEDSSVSIVFDFEPPTVAVSSLQLEPGDLAPGLHNPLNGLEAQAITWSTTAHLQLYPTEPVQVPASAPTSPCPSLAPDPDLEVAVGSTAPFLCSVGALGLASSGPLAFDLVLDGGNPSPGQGAQTLFVTLTDLANNTSARMPLSLPAPGVIVDTVPPSEPDTHAADAIFYRRVPWGRDEPIDDSLDGVPHFEVFATSTSLNTGDRVITYAGAPSALVPSATDIVTASEVGRAAVTTGGSFFARLVRADRPLVYLAVADRAGNLSDADASSANGLQARAVRNVLWTASLGGKQPGSSWENPHTLSTQRWFGSPLLSNQAYESSEPDKLLLADSTTATTYGTGRWQDVSGSPAPSGRAYHAMAYDAARGRAVLVGGNSLLDGMLDGTWEWDGLRWLNVCAQSDGCTSPPPAVYGAMAYDEQRGVTVLFGGNASGVIFDNVWEWDGTRWLTKCGAGTGCSGPSGRWGQAMSFDRKSGRVLMFGGCNQVSCTPGARLNDLWAWDGTSWTLLCDGSTCSAPTGRQGSAMAYDVGRGETLISGGCLSDYCDPFDPSTMSDELWAWSGGRWQLRCGGGSGCSGPAAHFGAAMAYDEVRDVIVMTGGERDFGGYADVSNQTWEWNGVSWLLRCPGGSCGGTSPTAKFHGAVFDRARSLFVQFSGCEAEYCELESPRTSFWDGSTWREHCSSSTGSCTDPSPRFGPAMSSRGGGVLLFGGYALAGTPYPAVVDETWAWDPNARAWTKLCGAPGSPCGPGTRAYAALASPPSGSSVLFGGFNGSTNVATTYLWNGSAWSNACLVPPCTAPAARDFHSLFYDAASARIALFGGDAGARSDEVWRFISPNWTKVCGSGTACSGPSARSHHAMSSDGGRRELMFGGDAGAYNDELWQWDGAALAWSKLCGSGTACSGPSARIDHAMAYDNGRQKAVLFGGYDGSAKLGDMWEWDATSQAWVQVCGGNSGCFGPSPRSLHAMAADRYQHVVLFGGQSSKTEGDTWQWEGGAAAAPGQVLDVAWSAAGGPSPHTCAVDPLSCSISAVDVDWRAGGVGQGEVAGARLFAWQHGAWTAQATNGSLPNAASSLALSKTDPRDVAALFFGQQSDIFLAVSSVAQNGTRPQHAEVASDYVEVTVSYRVGAQFQRLATDDFATSIAGAMWQSVQGDAAVSAAASYSDSYSLNLGGGGATADTVPLDTSSCWTVNWQYWGKRGPNAPAGNASLDVYFWDGTAWQLVDTWAGNGSTDTAFSPHGGSLKTPLALQPGFRLRFRSQGNGSGSDDFYIDNVEVVCGSDS